MTDVFTYPDEWDSDDVAEYNMYFTLLSHVLSPPVDASSDIDDERDDLRAPRTLH